jgi:hypothetical protein
VPAEISLSPVPSSLVAEAPYKDPADQKHFTSRFKKRSDENLRRPNIKELLSARFLLYFVGI